MVNPFKVIWIDISLELVLKYFFCEERTLQLYFAAMFVIKKSFVILALGISKCKWPMLGSIDKEYK